MIFSIHVLRALIQHSPDVLFAELAKLCDQQFAEVLKITDAEDCIDMVQWINSKFSTRVEEILFLNTTEECLAFPTVKTHSKEPMRGNNQRLKMDVIGMKYTSKKQFEVLILCSFPDKPLNSLVVDLTQSHEVLSHCFTFFSFSTKTAYERFLQIRRDIFKNVVKIWLRDISSFFFCLTGGTGVCYLSNRSYSP